MMLLAWLPFALANPAAGSLMVFVEGAEQCTLSIDGQDRGKLPLRIESVAAGVHTFAVVCPDGRTQTYTREVALTAGQLEVLKLGPMPAAPPAPVGAEPVPTYVLLSRIQGEKVRIDGGEPQVLPHRTHLTPGPHTFEVLEPDGTVRAKVTKDVVPQNGNAVVKLD